MSSVFTLFTAFLFGLAVSVYADEKDPEYDARLSGYAYPFDVHIFEFVSQRQSLEMAYMQLPAKDGRPTVLLLHDKNFAADYWKDTANYLHEKGYGVLMPDQIGFGKSSKPTHYQFSFEALANNTQKLVNTLGINKLIVMGHSMDGMLALPAMR